MQASYILALDQGTTSSRSILFDQQGAIVGIAQKEFKQHYPQPGWVEHDAHEIWETQLGTMGEVIAKGRIQPHQIAAIGITNQRETTVLWDRPLLQEKTGLILDAYFSATKIKWLLDHTPGAREKAAKGQLAFGTMDCWLIWKLSKGKVHATDVTNASRTMLYNIHTLQWDQELLKLFDIPQSVLPTVVSSSGVIGNCEVIPGYNIPIGGIAGDQQAALFGQLCIDQGMVKNFIGGAVVQWLRDQLKVIHSAPDIEKLASSVPDSQGVYVVPAFAGLGAPYWNAYARGSIFGLTRGSNQAHIARAALDSIAYQSADLLHAMQADAKIPIQELRVDGGATVNDLLMQFQSDLLDCKVVRPVITETTALGAAYLAGLAVGYWTSKEQLRSLWKSNHSFTPQIDANTRQQLLKGWQRAVNASIAWATNQ